MTLKEAFKIMSLSEKDAEAVKVFKRTISLLFYLKTGETIDVSDLKVVKIGNDVLALESEINLGVFHELESEQVVVDNGSYN